MELTAPLNIEDYIPQPVVFASPPKWHLGHTTWFFEEMILKPFLDNYKPFDDSFNYIFNSYYKSVGERVSREKRGSITRPTVKEVLKYRSYIDEHMNQLFNTNYSDEIKKLIVLGINHEQQHQELLLTDLKYTFSLNPIYPKYKENFDLTNVKNEATGWHKVEAGVYTIVHSTDDFCFDNELGKHKVYLHDFEISRSLVTNKEFIEFIEADGYNHFEFWLDEGWQWIKNNNIKSPMYWIKKDNNWFQYTLDGIKKIEPDSILTHVSFYEANAFANWKGLRLATEFEWEVASDFIQWGQRWEWTNSAYLPYPKFKIAEGSVGEYNGKFMINQMVLRGASSATAKNHSRKTYRNFFYPHFQWQYTGIRLAK